MPQPRFDRSQLHVLPLAERIHDMPLTRERIMAALLKA